MGGLGADEHMDTNKESSGNLAVWLPGSALIVSLVLSALALNKAPFLDSRPVGAQFQPQTLIEARLWQDPFDALERHLERRKDKTGTARLCDKEPPIEPGTLIIALVKEGAFAEDVENRRRMRYAVLAGMKNARMVPTDEEHVGCFSRGQSLRFSTNEPGREIPFEKFEANPFDPPTDIDERQQNQERATVFWLKQELLGEDPLGRLENLRQALGGPPCRVLDTDPCPRVKLKVIGPADSEMLRKMYYQEGRARGLLKGTDAKSAIPAHVEIYSPLATADKSLLLKGFATSADLPTGPLPEALQLVRTVSDDSTMARLLLDELKLRNVDPATGAKCPNQEHDSECFQGRRWPNANRVALISEWDTAYSRALIESFRERVEPNPLSPRDTPRADNWVLRFSYLRGLDGRLAEKAAPKTYEKDTKSAAPLDLGPLEASDGNSQLDYLRRLADHIKEEDLTYRRNNQSGIGAIGVLGVDTYDKLLVLQALKSRLPNKIFFSTDLDARMLQRGQAEITRNLILAAPYGLTLTRALQQDVPPFRDSLQSAVFISVLAALSPQSFDAKRWKFDYSKSGLLSPLIYEVGITGFVPLPSESTQLRPPNCAPAGGSQSAQGTFIRPQDIMALRCLQDPSQPLYPQPSQALKDMLHGAQSYFLAGPLALLLLLLLLTLGWWRAGENKDGSIFVRRVPLMLYGVAALTAWVATRYWRVELLWLTFILVLLGLLGSNLNRIAKNKAQAGEDDDVPGHVNLFDSLTWYLAVPLVVFVLVLLGAYQVRDSLTEDGQGEPMFMFEGISAWPTVALRLLAVIMSVSAVAWGWRNLRLNRESIEREYHLGPPSVARQEETEGTKDKDKDKSKEQEPYSLWGQVCKLASDGVNRKQWFGQAIGLWLYRIFLPLSPNAPHPFFIANRGYSARPTVAGEGRTRGVLAACWREHCICGSLGARLLRAGLMCWVFLVVCSAFLVFWPSDGIPVRGNLPIWSLTWLLPTLAFHFLVFWVVDANRLLARFIRHLSVEYSLWPLALRKQHEAIFGTSVHPCIDDWAGLTLVARRTAAVNRLIYAPTVVMLVLIASRSSVFDNWPTPPGLMIMFGLTALILLASALWLRRAAENARKAGLQRLDTYLLQKNDDTPEYTKFRMLRERIVALNTGAFSRYADEPLVRALLLSLTGVGGTVIVDALNYAKF
jgi:hypothetical protein